MDVRMPNGEEEDFSPSFTSLCHLGSMFKTSVCLLKWAHFIVLVVFCERSISLPHFLSKEKYHFITLSTPTCAMRCVVFAILGWMLKIVI